MCKDAPKYSKELNNEQEVADFVDKYASCKKILSLPYDLPLSLEERDKLIARQTHRHTHTCYVKDPSKKICRFKFPKPPFDKTVLLTPLESLTAESSAEDKRERQKHKINFKKIDEALNTWNENGNCTMNTMSDLITHLEMSEADYINAVRSSISTETVFLKRRIDERWINAYNPITLARWGSNMDIQYISNAHACASYILDYVTKGEKGMSKTLQAAEKEATIRGLNQAQKLKRIIDAYMNISEIGAQEAAYFLLGIPLTYCSRSVVFVNTSENPTRFLKSEAEIALMEDDDDDIVQKNMFDRYQDRPQALSNICLAEFVAFYDGLGKGRPINKKPDKEEFAPEKESEDKDDDTEENKESTTLKAGIKRRVLPRILRYVNFRADKDPEEHFRELLFLYCPFRDSSKLKGKFSTYEARYNDVKGFVDAQKAFYAKYQEDFGPELEIFNVDDEQDDNDVVAEVAPSAAQSAAESMQQQREAESNLPPPERKASHLSYRIEQAQNVWSNNQIYEGLATCTKAQFDFILNFVNKVKRQHQSNESDGKVWFLSGGAGVGKTRTTHLLCEILKKYFNRMPGCDQNKLQVVKCAFCGKAAHQVGGHTIHTLFKMGFGDSKNDHLRSDKLAELQDMLGDLKVLIIDEISMVNNGILGNIDKRLRAIKGKDDACIYQDE